MTNITNIGGSQNVKVKKNMRKISFDKGEVFSGKVQGEGKDENSVIIKLHDGWEFEAKLEKPMHYFKDKPTKFEVVGYENGKLKIKVVNGQKNIQTNKDPIQDIIKKFDGSLKKQDYQILKNMLKHEIPLTKENISKIKTYTDFINKLNCDELKGQEFIDKYLISKNIDSNSEMGIKITGELKEFFSQLKEINLDKILTMLENGIELSGENIKSFNSLISENGKLYKQFNKIEKKINLDGIIKSKDIIQDEKTNIKEQTNVKEQLTNINEKKSRITLKDSNSKDSNFQKNDSMGEHKNFNENLESRQDIKIDSNKFLKERTDIFKTNKVSVENIIEKLNKFDIKASRENIQKVETLVDLKTLLNSSESSEKEIINNYVQKQNIDIKSQSGKVMQKKIVQILDKIKHGNIDKLISNLKKVDNSLLNTILKKDSSINKFLQKIKIEMVNQNDKIYTSQEVKNKVDSKIQQMKNVIKTMLNDKVNMKPELISIIKNNINDIKMFNSISNQYYYMDVPISMKNYDYNCKLIIKDDRKSGKKIDSKNVKIAATVKTINMGEVDAYIKVFEDSMNVEIKSEDVWVKSLSKNKEKIATILSKMGYNVSINVSEKQHEVNIVNCRDFFEESKDYGINIKV